MRALDAIAKWSFRIMVFAFAAPFIFSLLSGGLIAIRQDAFLSAGAVLAPLLLALWVLYRWYQHQCRKAVSKRPMHPVPARKHGRADPPTVQLGTMQRHQIDRALPDELAKFLGEKEEQD